MDFLRIATKVAPILALSYILSYASMCRWCFFPTSGYERINHGGYPDEPARLPGYALVEELIDDDDSAWREPLLDWADFWDCGIYTRMAASKRYIEKAGQWRNRTDAESSDAP